MMKLWNLLCVILVGGCLFVGVFYLLQYLFGESSQLIIGVIVGLIPAIITIYLQRENQKREHQNWILRNKDAFLIEIIDIYTSLLGSNKKQDVEKRLKNIQPAILAHGSGNTLKAWEELMSSTENVSLKEMARRGERFFRAIRKDLGRDDSKVRAGSIYATIVNLEERQAILDACKGEKYD